MKLSLKSLLLELPQHQKKGITVLPAWKELEKYANQHATHFIHYSSLNKLGINPQQKFNTPLGIYSYPLTEDIFEQFKKRSVPYRAELPFVHLFHLTNKSKIVTLNSAGESADYDFLRLNKDIEFLKIKFDTNKQIIDVVKLYGDVNKLYRKIEVWLNNKDLETKDVKISKRFMFVRFLYANIKKRIDTLDNLRIQVLFKILKENIQYLQSLPTNEYEDYTSEIELLQSVKQIVENLIENSSLIDHGMETTKLKKPFGVIWNITRLIADGNIAKWNKILRMLGIEGVIDYGTGLIHPAEPIQAVFFSRNTIKEDGVFSNTKKERGEKSPAHSDEYEDYNDYVIKQRFLTTDLYLRRKDVNSTLLNSILYSFNNHLNTYKLKTFPKKENIQMLRDILTIIDKHIELIHLIKNKNNLALKHPLENRPDNLFDKQNDKIKKINNFFSKNEFYYKNYKTPIYAYAGRSNEVLDAIIYDWLKIKRSFNKLINEINTKKNIKHIDKLKKDIYPSMNLAQYFD